MDKNNSFIRDAALYLDIYGGLLTDRQAEILDFYYNEDYTLSEIAQGFGISKQAAHDALRNGTAALSEYENKLGMVRTYRNNLENIDEARVAFYELRDAINQIKNSTGMSTTDIKRQISNLDSIMLRVEKFMLNNSQSV